MLCQAASLIITGRSSGISIFSVFIGETISEPTQNVKNLDNVNTTYKDKEDVWEIKREYWQGAIKTPTKLPAELIDKILDYSSEEGDVVLDPFLGSGQVAVVSKMKGRHYIGFEIVPAYYEFALDRLESGKYLIQKTEEKPVWDLFSQEA